MYFQTICIIFIFLSPEMLQKILEKPLEKKAGRNYGPPAGKTLIYFIDDINMPEVSWNINLPTFILYYVTIRNQRSRQNQLCLMNYVNTYDVLQCIFTTFS